MIKLNTLSPSKNSRKANKRVGRGQGTGRGGTATRGHKGARSRSGYGSKPGFEGGQMPLQRRLPKRGFTNVFKKQYTLISLSDIEEFDAGSTVNMSSLYEAGIIKSAEQDVKLLANGKLSKALTVELDNVSRGAREQVIAAGGTVKE